jgi:hypothetical protein
MLWFEANRTVEYFKELYTFIRGLGLQGYGYYVHMRCPMVGEEEGRRWSARNLRNCPYVAAGLVSLPRQNIHQRALSPDASSLSSIVDGRCPRGST